MEFLKSKAAAGRHHSSSHHRQRSRSLTRSFSIGKVMRDITALDADRVPRRRRLVCWVLSLAVVPRWGLLPGESPAPITTWNLLHVGAAQPRATYSLVPLCLAIHRSS
ncbi:hypothetical protein K435DRAFT_418518 [Dendrothele bispora CBS 962.96]|uniref:Uncharacterized protein n=1 Tax=Dendrothele bispora (strain CBS 962.96) TaxID=1314807 RepID=A0A4S8MUV3_DENBC|nr:hypothetical protein K435DRAFT_418518 [Dendrothele bispora CBS 962.96]